jgi:hypothetical protein
MGQADDDGVPATPFAVAGLGVGGGMSGQLHQRLSPAGADGFGEQVTFRVGLTQEAKDGFGDDEAGFGIQPAIDSPTSIEGFGQVQMLGGSFAGSLIGRLVRRRSRDEFFGDDAQLLRGERRGLLG